MARGRECVVIRTGAFGDVLMASAVLPALAAEGWRLTLATSWEGETVLRHDPYLAGRIRVWPRQPDTAWGAIWTETAREFDRVINLVHGMEGTILRHPSQLSYYWPDDQRRRTSAGSYLAAYLAQAGVAGPARIRFVPNRDETAWARQTVARWGGRPLVVWSLRGSTPHKVYPHVPQAVSRVIAQSDAAVVLVGDLGARPIEEAVLGFVQDALGDAAVRRIYSLVGEGCIRRPLTLAQAADVVIGPETVVPMAVAHEPHVRKVVLLSHSAPSNLTDDWINTDAIVPDVACHPCHRLHYDHTYCPQDEATGAAACAAAIPPGRVAEAVLAGLGVAA